MQTTKRFEATLRQLVEESGFEAGVSVRHVERGDHVGVNGAQRFPACSVFKVPVLIEAFRRIAVGDLSLLQRWQLEDDEKAVGSGVLQLLDARLAPTTHDLLTLMIVISDNTAADMLTRGLQPERITATMRDLGLHDTWVSVTCRELIASAFGPGDVRLAPYERARANAGRTVSPDAAAYIAGPDNDVTSADDMTALFGLLQTGDRLDQIGIGETERRAMLAILHRQQLNDRLPRYVPSTLPFAHKTGSMSGPVEIHNDAGLLEIEGDNHIAVAAFVVARDAPAADPRALSALRRRMDDLIAEVGRAAYDQYAAN